MNRDAFQTSSHQQMMIGENPSLWNLSNMRPAAQPLLPSSSSSATSSSSASTSSVFPQYPQLSNLQLMTPLHDNHDQLPESWSQLLLGGLVEEEDRCSFTPFLTKKIENWELACPPSSNMADVKREIFDQKGYLYCGGQGCEEIQAARSPWSQILPNSSPRSCVTTSTLNSNMLDFSNCKTETKNQLLDRSPQECNSTPTGSPYKKARVQPSSAQSTFKVRKEKLGDRITALHQLVSPFGKTDTASVLLEAIGYIRFLQGQIEALSSPYLATGSAANMKQQQQQQHQQHAQGERACIFPEDPGQLLNDNCTRGRAPDQDGKIEQEPRKDLRSRGLCLVPVSFTLHVGSDNGADYWAPTFGGGFR